jgi:hypothetical protein
MEKTSIAAANAKPPIALNDRLKNVAAVMIDAMKMLKTMMTMKKTTTKKNLMMWAKTSTTTRLKIKLVLSWCSNCGRGQISQFPGS